MHIRIDLNSPNSILAAAQNILSEFIHDNPNKLSEKEIDQQIQLLSDQILRSFNSSSKPNNGQFLDLEISENNLSAEIKTWALSTHILEVKSLRNSEVTTDVSDVEEKSLPPYSFANQDWSDVKLVQMAKGGQRGAWFYINPERGSVVVKSQAEAEKQVMGTVFLRGLNVNSPDAKIVKRTSKEGKQLSELGENHGLNKDNPTHYIVMNRVKGPNYGDLTSSSEDIQMVQSNLEALGELAIYDLVLHNFDRFQLDGGGFNAGNIMFENDVLHPIDTDCLFDEERMGFTKLALKKIIENRGDYEDKIALKLAKNLGGGVPQEHFSKEKIKIGMNRAIDKLIELTKNLDEQKKRFISSCRERGVESNSFPDHLEELLLFLLKCKKS